MHWPAQHLLLYLQSLLQKGDGAFIDRAAECWQDVFGQRLDNWSLGFNMRKVTKGAVTIKLWDLGGQVKQKSNLLQML